MCVVRRTWRVGLLLTVLAGLVLPAGKAIPGLIGSSARSLIQQGSFTRALEVLSGEGASDAGKIQLFQKAYCLQRLERWPQAAELYQGLISSGEVAGEHNSQASMAEEISPAGDDFDSAAPDSILDDYLLLFAATCLLHSEDYTAAERHLYALLDRPESLLKPEADELLGQLFLRWGRPEQAIRVYRRLSAESSGGSEYPRFRYGLAAAYRQAGRTAEAAAVLEEIISGHPSSREALTALADYLSLRGEPLEGEMLYRAGWVYYHGRQYDRAAGAWDRFAVSHPRHELTDRALFLSARALFQDGRYESARERCRRLLSGSDRSDWLTSSRFLMARCDEGEGLTGQAIEQYRRFAKTYPWSRLADDALWRLARILERDGDLAGAEKEYWNLSQRYGSRKNASLALWRAGMYALYRGDTGTARNRLRRLVASRTGGDYADGALYWIARTYAGAGDRRQAALQMEKVIRSSGEGYYADLAGSWLGTGSGAEIPDHEPLTDILAGMKEISPAELTDDLRIRMHKGRQLVHLGLLSRARPELKAVHEAAHDHPQAVKELLGLYEDYQLPADALRLAVSLQQRRPQSRVRQAAQYFLYPLAYAQLVEDEAEAAGLDPFLILALMRTESLFDHLAISPAGARGLMQIMPATGREIAARMGASGGEGVNLYDPQWSIRMGVHYLGQQIQAYDGQVQFALAAYNAGPGNTNRWLKRLPGIDPELFVELIDFGETRQFIKKVLAAQSRYRKVWGHAG